MSAGGGSLWVRRVRSPLDAAAAVAALQSVNTITIANPGATFWKVRNVILELKLEDGTLVHLAGEDKTWSSPVAHPWAEGLRLSPGQNVATTLGPQVH